MSLDRNVFLDSLIKDSVRLNTIFMNHSGPPAKLHTDTPSLDLLTDKKGSNTLISYCQSHPLIHYVELTPRYMRTKLQLFFKDGSQLNIKIIRKMVRKSLDCIPVKEVMKAAKVNDFGMLIPSDRHHFEFIMLKYQFSEASFPDKFQKYFSSLEFENRTEVFRYIQPKYNLVFNVIEDLYIHKASVLLKIMIGLRHLNNNTLSKMFFRLLQKGVWSFFNLFTQKSIILQSEGSLDPSSGDNAERVITRKIANKKARF